LEEEATGKRLLGRPHLRWDDLIWRDVEGLGGGMDWNIQASNSKN